jgi:aerobic C4-dicarboxylate transport protein
MAASKNPTKKKPLYKDLFVQVISAIVIGILFGYFYPQQATAMKPLGEGFINLIKMMIAPIIFCTMVTGIAGMGNVKSVGRVGAKAILYFEVITTIALVFGLLVVNFFQPGSDLNIDVASYDTSAIAGKVGSNAPHMPSTVDFIMGMIPHTLVGAFSEGNILQVLVISILFAAGLTALGEKGKDVVAIIESFSHVLFKMIDIITKLAPIGAFGAMAYTVGKFGIGSLKDLGELILLFYFTGFVFVVCLLAPIMRFYCKLSLWQFVKYIKEELLIVLGTSSSESVLPRMIERLTAMGCSKSVVGLVVPAGYSFNLDGSSLYFTMAAIFIAYATDTPLTFGQEMALLGVLLVTSKGAAGVTGSAFIVLAATLSSMNIIPEQNLQVGLALIFAIDRFMSTGRAIINLIGNGIATIVIAKWENALDHKLAQDVLSGKKEADFGVLETQGGIGEMIAQKH